MLNTMKTDSSPKGNVTSFHSNTEAEKVDFIEIVEEGSSEKIRVGERGVEKWMPAVAKQEKESKC